MTRSTRRHRQYTAIPVLVGLGVALGPGPRGPASPRYAPDPGWTFTAATSIRHVGFPPAGDCFVLTTDDRLLALDRAGQLLWQVTYSSLGRWVDLGPIAAGPACRWAIAAGQVGYRYVWRVGPSGSWSTPTRGTPLAVAVDSLGQSVAVGTGAGDVLVLGRNGRVAGRHLFPGGIIEKVMFSPNGRLIALAGGNPIGVVPLVGKPRWIGDLGGHLATDHDWRNFLEWWEPNHFSTRGFASWRDSTGTERWNRVVHSPTAAIAPDGSYGVVVGVVEDSVATEAFQAEPEQARFQVIAADGRLLARGPSPMGRAVGALDGGFLIREAAADPGGSARLVARSRTGDELWSMPIDVAQQVQVILAIDSFLVWSGEKLSLYRMTSR